MSPMNARIKSDERASSNVLASSTARVLALSINSTFAPPTQSHDV